MSTCEMVLIEDGDLNYYWECSECGTSHKATDKFEKSKECPTCGAEIKNWIGFDEDDDLYGELHRPG